MIGESMIRAVSGEGFLQINGKKWSIGGLSGQPERAYLKDEWIENMTTVPQSFLVEDFEIRPVGETLPWARNRWALNKKAATGKELVFTLRGSEEFKDVAVKVCFAIYDEVPVIRKRMEVENHSTASLNIDAFQLEYLAFAEPESPGDGNPDLFRLPNIHIESDYACKGTFTERETDITENGSPTRNTPRSGTTRWKPAAYWTSLPKSVRTRPSSREIPSVLSMFTKCPSTAMTASAKDCSPVTFTAQ